MGACIGLDEAPHRHNQSVAFNRFQAKGEINELDKNKNSLDLCDRGKCF